MPVYADVSAYCPYCDRYVLARERVTNHVLHLLMSALFCGCWLPIWLLVWVTNPSVPTCPRCGGVCEGDAPTGMPRGWVVAVVGLCLISPFALAGLGWLLVALAPAPQRARQPDPAPPAARQPVPPPAWPEEEEEPAKPAPRKR